MWPLLHANSFEEPLVRAEYQVEPKAGELLREHHMPSRQRYYPSLTPRTPLKETIHTRVRQTYLKMNTNKTLLKKRINKA